MKQFFTLILTFLCSYSFAQFHRCDNIKAILSQSEISELLQTYRNLTESRSLITISVVVHIVWNQEEENISDEQVLSQIEVLNEDFRGLNSEISGIPPNFLSKLANIELEFCLVENGIQRVYTDVPNIGNVPTRLKYSTRGGADAWDTNRYLNLWVAKRSDGILGAATRLDSAPPEEQGLAIDYRAFGRLGAAADNVPYELGRTATHELGHFFGLQHLWGEVASCLDDDGLVDTPSQSVTYSGQCPSSSVSSCGSADMYMNFMNYTNDACMGMFTHDQKALMLAYINTFRAGLLEGGDCEMMVSNRIVSEANSFKVYPNPVQNRLWIDLEHPITSETRVFIHNNFGKLLQTLPLSSHQLCLDAQEWSRGVYFLSVQFGQTLVTEKFIIL